MTSRWVSVSLRDEIVHFVMYWKKRTGLSVRFFLEGIKLLPNRFYEWKKRKTEPNRHNGHTPKSHWLLEDERLAIINYAKNHPDVGYRRLTFMMLDANLVAVSPSSVYRVLLKENLLQMWDKKSSKKGTGFEQPMQPHEHWHIDISYIHVSGTFYYLLTILDGYSRYIVSWKLRETMKEPDVELTIQAAIEQYPKAKPRIISDNGPQFIANDFKSYIRIMELSHVTTSPYYPQSNGKLERYHRSLKSECIREQYLSDEQTAKTRITEYVQHYNHERLHSAIGYIKPVDKLNGLAETIMLERKRKLKEALEARKECNKKIILSTNNNSTIERNEKMLDELAGVG